MITDNEKYLMERITLTEPEFIKPSEIDPTILICKVRFLLRGNLFKWRPKQKPRQVLSVWIIPTRLTGKKYPEQLWMDYFLPNGKINYVKLNINDIVIL